MIAGDIFHIIPSAHGGKDGFANHLLAIRMQHVESRAAGVALHFIHYDFACNFARIHKALRIAWRWRLAYPIRFGGSRKLRRLRSRINTTR